MAEDETAVFLLIVVAIVAVVGLGLAVASFTTNTSVGGMMGGGTGGGMMGGGGSTSASTSSPPGAAEWALLAVSALFFVASFVLILLRGPWSHRTEEDRDSPPTSAVRPSIPTEPSAVQAAEAAPRTPPPVPEPALVKLLDEDERRMYLEIRDHHGEMFQRDLVALGTFSKAKVTRVLDKLEAKGVVVRERHGMTNRVRILSGSK